jgi:hypothetical protein
MHDLHVLGVVEIAAVLSEPETMNPVHTVATQVMAGDIADNAAAPSDACAVLCM